MGDMCLPQFLVLYQTPGSLRFLCNTLAVPSIAPFWTESSGVIPGMCWSHSSSLEVIAPTAPTTTGILWPLLSSSSLVTPSGHGTSPASHIPDVAITWHHCCL